jgi:hypothetical protein
MEIGNVGQFEENVFKVKLLFYQQESRLKMA